MVSQVEAVLRGEYPSLYISLEARHDIDDLVTVRLRYSLKYNREEYPQLFNKQIVVRVSLELYRNHPDREYLMNSQIYRVLVDHLERDLSNLNGLEYLERYRNWLPTPYSDPPFDPRLYFTYEYVPCPWSMAPRLEFRGLDPLRQRSPQDSSSISPEYYQNIFRQVLNDLNRSSEPLSGHWDGLNRPENKKAEKLLLRFLNEEQKEQYEKDKTFICYSDSGNAYRVLPKLQVNIDVLDQNLNRKHSLCITPTETVPAQDQQLAIKLLIENNESYLLETAIKWP